MGKSAAPRLFVDAPLSPGTRIDAAPEHYHYLAHILRLKPGDPVLLFNGLNGEWRAALADAGKKSFAFAVTSQTRPQRASPDVWLVFAPVKNEKIDYTVKRATELGVSALLPVLTERTAVSRVNMERLHANAIEAAEQSGRLDMPALHDPRPLARLLSEWPSARILLFCDESGAGERLKILLPRLCAGPYAVLIGPEGGFSPAERELIRSLPFTRAVGLGPRILRAETAALAALSNLMAWAGDWDEQPEWNE